MNKNIKVSVIVPVFNQEKYLGRCLRSLISQSMVPNEYEIILVNDGSSDNTIHIIDSFKEKILVINNVKNIGLPSSLNLGIKKSKGKYIVRVDADDYVNSDFLKFLYTYINENEDFDAVGCDYYLVNEKEEIIKRNNCSEHPIGCGIIFRSDQLFDIGLYNPNFFLHEERELMSRFLKKYKIRRLEIPLYRYRRHADNITNNKKESSLFLKKLKKKIK
jgi:glycosyltransferase involved in cell wall biosynthesis